VLAVLVIGLLTGITFWFVVVQRLETKPWLEQGEIPATRDRRESSAPKIRLIMFLGVVTSLFLLGQPRDWRGLFALLLST
jgi:hypothetical protein